MIQKMSESVGDRMKGYEFVFTSVRIDPALPFVMRLDGHSFSRFARGLKKPYDYNFHQCFVNTTMELMKEFHADTGYTHSDEISLLFYPKLTKDGSTFREPHFGGRVQKIITIASSICTMIFNNELKTIFSKVPEQYADKPSTYERMMSSRACFDCRIFQLPSEVEMFSYLYWRSQVDCKRNHVFELSRRHYPKKELEGKSTGDRIKMLADKGIIWDAEPACFRRGTFFKRVPRNTEDGSIRFDFKEVSVELTKFNEDINELLKCEVYVKKADVSNTDASTSCITPVTTH